MNEEKLKEVGALTEVDSKKLTQKKIRKKISLTYYFLIQLAFFIFSSLVGLVFGLYSRSIAAYPYSGFPQRYLYGPIILVITHGGNFGLSFWLSRNKRLILSKNDPKELSPLYIYSAIVLNLILSTIFLFATHNFVLDGSIFTISTAYGVYENKHMKIKKNFFRFDQK